MTDLRQAAQQALEALENASDIMDSWAQKRQDDAITALRAALAEPVQEPMAWEASEDGRFIHDNDFTYDAMLRVSGDFESDEQRIEYVRGIVAKLNAAPQVKAEPVQEPVAWIEHGLIEAPDGLVWKRGPVGHYTPLYTAPTTRSRT